LLAHATLVPRAWALRAPRCARQKIFTQEAAMKEDSSNDVKRTALSFECNGCGQFFESWERLRQHEVDCKDDDVDNQL
jgi:hypothetical protein